MSCSRCERMASVDDGVSRVIQACADFYRVTADEIRGPSKRARRVRPSHVAMYLWRKLLGASFAEIGHRFGGRDHSTAWYAVLEVESLAHVDGIRDLSRLERDAVASLAVRR